MNGINPIQLIGMLKNSGNPKAMLTQMAQQNPVLGRAIQMTDGKSPQDINTIAKNLCQQQGVDFDQAFSQFKQQFGGML